MNTNLKCSCKLAEYMRDLVPVPGHDFRKMILVEMKPGESVAEHQHRGHTALYYPADCDQVIIKPVAGMVIILPPGTPHLVPSTTSRRVSVAMIVDDQQ